jgi:hypothetical protein
MRAEKALRVVVDGREGLVATPPRHCEGGNGLSEDGMKGRVSNLDSIYGVSIMIAGTGGCISTVVCEV